ADLGGGYLRTTGSRGGSSFATQGGALGVGVAVGWAPTEEWALGLELWTWKSLADSGLGPNTSVELQALGLNVTRYIVPEDVFAAVVVSGTRLAITDAGDRVEYASSDIGFGLKVLLGKEWRLTPWLGLGVAGELFLSVNRAGGATLRTVGGAPVFSCAGPAGRSVAAASTLPHPGPVPARVLKPSYGSMTRRPHYEVSEISGHYEVSDTSGVGGVGRRPGARVDEVRWH